MNRGSLTKGVAALLVTTAIAERTKMQIQSCSADDFAWETYSLTLLWRHSCGSKKNILKPKSVVFCLWNILKHFLHCWIYIAFVTCEYLLWNDLLWNLVCGYTKTKQTKNDHKYNKFQWATVGSWLLRQTLDAVTLVVFFAVSNVNGLYSSTTMTDKYIFSYTSLEYTS